MTATENDLKNGRIVGIAGPVVDVEFPAGALPEINTQLEFDITVDGETTHLWGRVNMTFDRPAYPTGFSAQIGDCYEEPNVQWTGRE